MWDYRSENNWVYMIINFTTYGFGARNSHVSPEKHSLHRFTLPAHPLHPIQPVHEPVIEEPPLFLGPDPASSTRVFERESFHDLGDVRKLTILVLIARCNFVQVSVSLSFFSFPGVR